MLSRKRFYLAAFYLSASAALIAGSGVPAWSAGAANELRKSFTETERLAILESIERLPNGRPSRSPENPTDRDTFSNAVKLAGFSSDTAARRVALVSKRGVPELVRAMDDRKIAPEPAAAAAAKTPALRRLVVCRLTYTASRYIYRVMIRPFHSKRTEATMPRIHTSPGEILREDFLRPLGLSANALALALRVPATRIGDILRADNPRAVSADTAIRLGRYFGTSPEFWLNLQTAYDLSLAQAAHGAEIDRDVHPRGPAA